MVPTVAAISSLTAVSSCMANPDLYNGVQCSVHYMYLWVVDLRNPGPSGQIYQGGITSRKPDCIREDFSIVVMVCVALSAVPAAAAAIFLTVSYGHMLTNSPVIYRVVFCVQLILSFSPPILGVNVSRLCT